MSYSRNLRTGLADYVFSDLEYMQIMHISSVQNKVIAKNPRVTQRKPRLFLICYKQKPFIPLCPCYYCNIIMLLKIKSYLECRLQKMLLLCNASINTPRRAEPGYKEARICKSELFYG